MGRGMGRGMGQGIERGGWGLGEIGRVDTGGP
jgi:hypothetical protein